jgi:hypothetical protein
MKQLQISKKKDFPSVKDKCDVFGVCNDGEDLEFINSNASTHLFVEKRVKECRIRGIEGVRPIDILVVPEDFDCKRLPNNSRQPSKFSADKEHFYKNVLKVTLLPLTASLPPAASTAATRASLATDETYYSKKRKLSSLLSLAVAPPRSNRKDITLGSTNIDTRS